MGSEQSLEPPRQRRIQDHDVGRDARRYPQTALSAVGDVDHAPVPTQTSRDIVGDSGRGARHYNQQNVSAWHVSGWAVLLRQRVQHARTQNAARRGARGGERP
jgi:hypothetical protein